MTHAHMLLVAASAYSSTPTASDSLRALRFRPPAIPLFTTDPFTQTWMRGDTSTSAAVTHWTGTEKQLTGLVRVDGKAYTFLGNSTGSPPLVQRAMVAFPTRTAFELELPGVLALNLTFLSTMFTDDFPRLSRPVYYLAHEARALDGRTHEVQLYLDASAQHAVNTEDEPVAWGSAESDGFRAVRLGTAAQAVLGSKGDRVNIDWGQLLLGAPAGVIASVWAGSASASRTAFARSGSLPASPDSRQPRPCSDDLPALSLSRDLGEVGGAAVRHVAILAYDDTESVYFFGGRMKGLWTQHWSSITAAMAAAAAEYQPMLDKSVAHDEALLADTRAAGGDKYMALCALAYRQTLAATKLVWNPALKAPWNFLKEISTNGDMQTMDVIYPASPMLLHTSPELLRLLLLPVLAYANNETFIRFSNPYSPHQLGALLEQLSPRGVACNL